MVMKSIGLDLQHTHISASDARMVATILCQYCSSVKHVNLFGTVIDDNGASIITGLQNCTQLIALDLGTLSNAADSKAIAKVIEQNRSSLRTLVVPACDEDLPSIAPSITTCRQLVGLGIGSRALTNKPAPAITDTIRCHRSLGTFGLNGRINDDGFTSIASSLLNTSAQLKHLLFYWTMLSVPMLSRTLTSLTSLQVLRIVGNPIGDDGFQQLSTSLQRLTSLRRLEVFDVGLTIQSVKEMDKLLEHSLTRLVEILMVSKRSAFLQTSQDVDDIAQLISMTVEKTRYGEGEFHVAYLITEQVIFINDHSRNLVLQFFD